MGTMPSFAMHSQGHLVKSNADSGTFDWFSCLNLQRPTSRDGANPIQYRYRVRYGLNS